jgi:hypothetical protein
MKKHMIGLTLYEPEVETMVAFKCWSLMGSQTVFRCIENFGCPFHLQTGTLGVNGRHERPHLDINIHNSQCTSGFQVNALLKEANNAVHVGSDKNGEPFLIEELHKY